MIHDDYLIQKRAGFRKRIKLTKQQYKMKRGRRRYSKDVKSRNKATILR